MIPDSVQPPPEKRPDEHPTFHRNSMLGLFVLLGCGFLLMGLEYWTDLTIPGWAILALLLAAGGWMLYRAQFATPRCRSCRNKAVTRLENFKEIVGKDRNLSRWRRFRCENCDKEFIIPGISMDG